VAFSSTASNLTPDDTDVWPDVFVHDIEQGITERISMPKNVYENPLIARAPDISADGRYVVYRSPYLSDTFVHDRLTGERVTLPLLRDTFFTHPKISGDGQTVVLAADDGNRRRQILRYRRNTGYDWLTFDQSEIISTGSKGTGNDDSGNPAINFNGRYIAFDSYADNLDGPDGNGVEDIFVHFAY